MPTMASLVAEHGEAVRRVAYRITMSDGAAQEVAQEVFIRAWSHGGYDGSRGSIDRWLRMMTQYAAIDWIRREVAHRRRLERVGAVHGGATPTLVEESAVETSQAAEVRAAVAQLPIGERDAISLAYFGGLSYREVAERLGLAEGTVKSQIRRGLARLAVVLGPLGAATT
jgi:RNA polymerase sigma-70 factor (ECF subfamily)